MPADRFNSTHTSNALTNHKHTTDNILFIKQQRNKKKCGQNLLCCCCSYVTTTTTTITTTTTTITTTTSWTAAICSEYSCKAGHSHRSTWTLYASIIRTTLTAVRCRDKFKMATLMEYAPPYLADDCKVVSDDIRWLYSAAVSHVWSRGQRHDLVRDHLQPPVHESGTLLASL